MNRAEYMRELSYLLQDVPDEEREEALQYYEDYFDDAGPDKEEQVVAELGRPEKVAAIIREGARNGYESLDAEYTENGYQNERYRGPQYEIVPPEQVKRKQIGGGTDPENAFDGSGREWSKETGGGAGDRPDPEEDTWGNRARSVFNELGQRLSEGVEEGRRRMEESRERRRQEEERRRAAPGQEGADRSGTGGGVDGSRQFYSEKDGSRQPCGEENDSGSCGGNGGYGQSYEKSAGGSGTSPNPPARRRRNPLLWILAAFGLLLLFPFILGAAALMFGLSLAVICGAGGIALAVIIIAAAFVVTGVILFGVGIGKLFVFPLAGMMLMGIGLILFGLGILAVWLSVMVCGRLIPGVVRLIGNVFDFFGRRRRGAA